MIVERNPNGSLTVSALVGAHLESHTFYDYTKEEAIKAFQEIYPEVGEDDDT